MVDVALVSVIRRGISEKESLLGTWPAGRGFLVIPYARSAQSIAVFKRWLVATSLKLTFVMPLLAGRALSTRAQAS